MSIAQRVTVGLAALLLGSAMAACSGGGNVATVNGRPITNSDFQAKLASSPGARNTLQQMVQEALILQYADDNHLDVSNDEIAKRENDLKANFPNGSWDEMLKARGLSEADVQQALREQIILDKALAKDVTIAPASVKSYFDKNHATLDKPEMVQARHILVANAATAQKVEDALKSGQSFAVVAKQYSTDPGTKDKGGELGFFRRGQMVPAFDKVAFTLPINQISAPVKSPFGFHIIQVEARQPGQKATLENSTAKISDTLRQQQEAPLIQPFLQGLQQKAKIDIADKRFADLFPPAVAAPGAPPAAAAPAATK